jgi:hypothetical protein
LAQKILILVELPLVSKVVEARQVPQVTPSQCEERHIRHPKRFGRKVGYLGSWVEIDLLACLLERKAKIDVLARAQHVLVQSAQSPKHVGPYKHAMELRGIRRLMGRRDAYLVYTVYQAVALTSVFPCNDDPRVASGEMHVLVKRSLFIVEWAYHGCSSDVGAIDKGWKPVRRNNDVVVYKDDIAGLGTLRPDVARLIGCEIVVVPNQLEISGACLLS